MTNLNLHKGLTWERMLRQCYNSGTSVRPGTTQHDFQKQDQWFSVWSAAGTHANVVKRKMKGDSLIEGIIIISELFEPKMVQK